MMQVDAIASNKLNAGTVMADGSIRLKQPNALNLQPDSFTRTVYDDNYFDKIEHMSMQRFLMNYQTERNETTYYEHTSQIMYGAPDQQYVDVKMIIKIPYQDIIYVPKFWEVIKFAWVQYFAIAIAFYYLLHY